MGAIMKNIPYDLSSEIFKDSFEWETNNEARVSAILALQDIFEDIEIQKSIGNKQLRDCCRILTQLLLNEIDEPNAQEKVKYQKEYLFKIGKILNILEDNNLIQCL